MKYFLSIVILFFSIANTGNSQCMQSKIASSDVRLPDEIHSGKKLQVYVTAYNIGDCDWMNGEVAMRVTIVRGPSGSAVEREELTTQGDIKMDRTEVDSKSGYGKFYYDIEGPDYAGEYILQFQLVHKGKPFGAKVQQDITVIKDYKACNMHSAIEPNDVDIPPILMAGKKYRVNISAENRGNCSWISARNKIELRVKCLSWPSGASSSEVSKIRPRDELVAIEDEEIDPKNSASFEYDLVGPSYPGVYVLEFQMVNEGSPFGAKCQKKIEVTGDPKRCDVGGTFIVTGVPSQMIYNEEHDIVVKLKNTGICPWVAASKVEIICKITAKPSGSPSQLPGLLPKTEYAVGSQPVDPDDYFEIRYEVKGPYVIGPYKMSWEVYKDGRPTGIKAEKEFKVILPK
jgi:hypothetical protein